MLKTDYKAKQYKTDLSATMSLYYTESGPEGNYRFSFLSH